MNTRYGGSVTETSEQTVITEALAVIDDELLHLAARDMVTASDVTNLLLDLRLLLAPSAAPSSPEPEPLPA
jgi:hypothetical protein